MDRSDGPGVINGQNIKSSIINVGGDFSMTINPNLPERQQRIDRLLRYSAFEAYHDAARKAYCPGTGGWFFDLKVYQDWLDSPGSILWLYGDAGVGKTTLTSTVIYMLQRSQPDPPMVLYFYCDYASKTDSTHVFATFLGQALGQCIFDGPYPASLQDPRAEKFQPEKNDIIACLTDVIRGSTRTYVIIESLHECNDAVKRRVLGVLRGFANAGISILISSRFVPNVEVYLSGSFPQYSSVELKSKNHDMEMYIDQIIEDNAGLKKIVARTPNLRTQIKDAVANREGITFLLVVLQMKEVLKQMSPNQVENALQRLSAGVTTAYGTTMAMIQDQGHEYRRMAYHTMAFLTLSKRPVAATELLYLLAVSKDHDEVPQSGDLYDIENIISACKGMVRISGKDSIVSFFHPSFQEFFVDHMKMCDDALDEGEIGLRCLHYVASLNSSLIYSLRLWDEPFFRYTSDHWGEHIKNAKADITPVVASYLQQDTTLKMLNWALRVGSRSERWDDDECGNLHHCAKFGLVSVAKHLMGRNVLALNFKSRGVNTALRLSSKHGRTDFVEFLLSSEGVKIDHQNAGGDTALSLAAENGHQDIVKLLLSHVAEPCLASESGRVALWGAARGGHIEIVKYLISCEGINVNVTDQGGSSALLVAAENGHQDIVKLLLSHDANPSLASKSGRTALQVAAWGGHIDIVRTLLSCEGVNVNATDEHGYSALFVAARNGHEDVVKLLLSHDANPNIAKSGETALSGAAREGHTKVMQILLSCEGINVNATNESGQSALHAALIQQFSGDRSRVDVARTIELLLSNGADPHLVPERGQTTLWFAANLGRIDVVRILLSKQVKINLTDNEGSSALLKAAQNGHQDVVELLLSHDANPHIASRRGETALGVAARGGHIGIVKTLLSCEGVNVNATDADGESALFLAARNGHEDVVKLLLSHDANHNMASKSGETALWHAARGGYLEIVKFLISCNNVNVNVTDRGGHSALFAAAADGHQDVVELLLSHDADPSLTSKGGRTALWVAAQGGHPEVIKVLLSCHKGVDVNATDEDGQSPLHRDVVADPNGCGYDLTHSLADRDRGDRVLGTIEPFLSNGADPHLVARSGATTLWLAAKHGSIDVASTLLSKQVNINLTDNDGHSALHIAVLYGHKEVVKILLSHGADPNLVNRNGYTPLCYAQYRRHENLYLYQLLLSHGPHPISPMPNHKQTLFTRAAKYGHSSVIRVMNKYKHRFRTHQADRNGDIPFVMAARYGHLDIVKTFLSYWFFNQDDLNRETTHRRYTHDGHTALCSAACYGQIEVVKYILHLVNRDSLKWRLRDNWNWGLNHITRRGLTPLTLALRGGHDFLASLILCDDRLDLSADGNRKWITYQLPFNDYIELGDEYTPYDEDSNEEDSPPSDTEYLSFDEDDELGINNEYSSVNEENDS